MIDQLGLMDIYLIDQLQKGRLNGSMKIFDAGCGRGRNAEYFIKNNYAIFGVDKDEESILKLKEKINEWNADFNEDNFKVADLINVPFPDQFFDFIISSAVLHFSDNRNHFKQQLLELIRVLNKNGFLFIRMTSKHTIERFAVKIKGDVYFLPDESTRYLLDKDYLENLMQENNLIYVEPFKTVNVADVRSMTTLVLMRK
ncbi:MAG: class I SAM-dependent methyltransferase [Bacteroidota bacterium]